MSIALRFVCRIAASALVASLAACSGGSTDPTNPTPGSPSTTSGGTANVIGNEGTGASAVPGDGATRIELAKAFCGAAEGSCAGDAAVQIVDFATSTLETHRCVVLNGDAGAASVPPAPPGTSPRFGKKSGDAITSRVLTAQEIGAVRTALDGIRYAPAKLTEYDGAMTVLSVETPTGKLSLTPAARCGGPDYEQIVSGLPALTAALDAL
jgi:hypothetical protein